MGRTARFVAMIMVAMTMGAAAAASAAGEELTRDVYVNQLEAICKPQAASHAARDGRGPQGRARRPPRGRRLQVRRAANIFGGTVTSIGKVIRPASDEAKLKEWFAYLNNRSNT